MLPLICLTSLKVIIPELLVPGEFMLLPYLDDKNYDKPYEGGFSSSHNTFRKVLGTHIVYRDYTSEGKKSAQIALRAPTKPAELQYESDLTYSRLQRLRGQYVMAEAFLQ
jgi:hypothetical protein